MASKTTAIVTFRAQDKISRPIFRMYKKVNFMFKMMRMDAKMYSRDIMAINRKLNSMVSGLRSKIPGIGLLSAGGLLYGGKEAIETSARLESMNTAIRFVSGSAEEGQKNIDFLNATTKDLGLDIEVATEGFKRLTASAKKTKSMESIRQMFYNMSVGIRTLGLDAQASERIFYALSEMFSKGTVMAQELKLQLGNSLPGAFDLMREVTKRNMKAFSKMMRAGDVTAKKYVEAFTYLIKRDYIKGLDDAKKTTAYVLSRIAWSWKMLLSDIGDMLAKTGVLSYIERIVEVSRDWIKANKQMIGLKLKEWFDKIVNFGKWVIDNWSKIARAVKQITYAFLMLKGVIAVMSLFALLTNPLSLILVSVGALIISIPLLADEFSGLKDKVKEVEPELSSLDTILLGLGNLWDDLFTLDMSPMRSLKTALVGVGEILIGILSMITDVAHVTGMMSDATYKERQVSRDALIKDMEAWATNGELNYDQTVIQNSEATGYNSSSLRSKPKISPYSIAGAPNSETKETTATTMSYLKIMADKRAKESFYLQNNDAAHIVLTDLNGIPYEIPNK